MSDLHDEAITGITCSNDGKTLLTTSRDGNMKLIETRTYKTIRTLEHEEFSSGSNSNKAALSPSGKFAIAGSRNGQLFVWNA